MVQVTYVPSLLDLAGAMCRLIARATPVIVRLYGGNAALLAALAAANAACEVLQTELLAVREFGD